MSKALRWLREDHWSKTWIIFEFMLIALGVIFGICGLIIVGGLALLLRALAQIVEMMGTESH